jgi:hypothetical protein
MRVASDFSKHDIVRQRSTRQAGAAGRLFAGVYRAVDVACAAPRRQQRVTITNNRKQPRARREPKLFFLRRDVRAKGVDMTLLSFSRGPARAAVLLTSATMLMMGNAAAADVSADGVDRARAPSRCSTAIEDRNLANFEAYLAALTSGDFTKALSYFAPGAVVAAYGSVPFAGTYSATDGAWAALQQQYWDFSAGAPQDAPVLYADCDKVILSGAFKRVALATGRAVDTRVIEYFTFDAQGRMVRDDFYLADTAAVNAALSVP